MHKQRSLRLGGSEAEFEELWQRFPESNRKEVVAQFARLIARAATAVSESSKITTKEQPRAEPQP